MSPDSFLRFLETRTPDNFADFVLASQPLVFNTAHRVCGNRDLARDVAQEVYTILLTTPLRADEVRNAKAWVASRTIRAAREQVRAEARRHAREEASASLRGEATGPTGTIGALAPEDAWDLDAALGALPSALQRVVELRYYADLEVQEVASELGITTRTVSKRLRSAEHILRSKLSASVALMVLPVLAGRREAVAESAADASLPRPHTLRQAQRVSTLALAGATAAAILLLTIGGAWLWSQNTSGGETGPVATNNNPNPGDGTADLVARDLPIPLADRGATPPKAENPATSPIVAATPRPKIVPSKTPEPARVTLHVVDEAGEPVRQGEVEFEARPATNLQRGLGRFAGALGFATKISPRSLSGANPLSIEIPPALHGLPIGVKVSAPGFAEHGVSSFTARPGQSLEVTVTLSSSIDVTFFVRNARSGEPVEGALIEVSDDPESLRADLAAMARLPGALLRPAGKTSAEGKLVVPDVRPRALALEITAQGYFSVRSNDVEPLETVTLWLHERQAAAATGALTVKILDPSGRPWPRCPFRLDGAYREESLRRTDDSGACRIEGLRAGLHVVEIHHPPIETTDESIELAQKLLLYRPVTLTLAGGGDVDATLRSSERTGRLRVKLVAESGGACPGVSISRSFTRSDAVTTDERGEALFLSLDAGRQEIFTGGRGAEVKLGDVDVLARGETRARMTFAAGVVRGKVVNEDGTAVSGASLACKTPSEIYASTDESGRFEIAGLKAGEYALEVVPHAEWLMPAIATVVVSPRGESSELLVRVRKGGTVTILAATPDGKPLENPGALRRLAAEPELGEELREQHRGRRESELRSPHPIEPGEHVFIVKVQGHAPQEVRGQVEAGKETVVRVEVGER